MLHFRSTSKRIITMHVAVVACGERLEETLIMIKSAILLSKNKLLFHIFADNELQPNFKKQVLFAILLNINLISVL